MSKIFMAGFVLFLITSISLNGISTNIVPSNLAEDAIMDHSKSSGDETIKADFSQTNEEEPFVFKLMTYNLLESGVFDSWRDVVVEENADIALFGETAGWAQNSVEDEDFQRDLNYINNQLEENGNQPYEYYNISVEPTTTTGGAVLLSRFPILETHQINSYPLDDGTDQVFNHDLFHSVLNINDVEVHIIGSVHWACCDYEERIQRRQLDMEAALNYIDDQGSVPFIFNGDFNTLSPKDKELEDEPEFEWMSTNLDTETLSMVLHPDNPKTTKNHKWKDVFRTLNPLDPGFTYGHTSDFWNSRLDYIFVNEFFFDKLVNSTSGGTQYDEEGSDHFNVDVTINMNPELADLRPPFPVYRVTGTVNSPSEFSLSWQENAANDTDHYNLFRDEELQAMPKINSYVDKNVEEGVLYKYQVSATDVNNNTGFLSDPLYYDTEYGVHTSPRKPFINGEGRPGQIYVNWTLEDDGGFEIMHYLLFRATEDSYQDNFFRIWETTTDTEFIDEIERPENNYYYMVLGVNKLGRGIISDVIKLNAMPVEDTESKLVLHPAVSLLSFFIMIPIIVKYRKNSLAKQ